MRLGRNAPVRKDGFTLNGANVTISKKHADGSTETSNEGTHD
jgi:hypothetical protein